MSVLYFKPTSTVCSNFFYYNRILTSNYSKTSKSVPPTRKDNSEEDTNYGNRARAALRRMKQRLKKIQTYGYDEKRRYMMSALKRIREMLKGNKKK